MAIFRFNGHQLGMAVIVSGIIIILVVVVMAE
jgi:hypothetical protein